MERYNSNARNTSNRALNSSNLTLATSQPVTHDSSSNYIIDLNMPVAMIDLNISYPMIDLNVPYVPDGGDQIASHDTASDFASSVREPGYRDDPIVIEDDDEDEHGDAQQGVIFYVEDMSYEGLLELQERIGVVGTGLKKKVISELLKQRKYQSTKIHDVNDSCCVCLDTYSDREVLGKIDCGHEFHYHCIRKWLKIKNSCPICKRTALTPRE